MNITFSTFVVRFIARTFCCCCHNVCLLTVVKFYKAAEKQELKAFQHVCGENSLMKYSVKAKTVETDVLVLKCYGYRPSLLS